MHMAACCEERTWELGLGSELSILQLTGLPSMPER